MTADKGIVVFRELAVGLNVPCKLLCIKLHPESGGDHAGMFYWVEITTPVSQGKARDVAAIRVRYHIEETRFPVRVTHGGLHGKLVWE
jgi:hypothetical protein